VKDTFGAIVTLLKADPAVAAIVGTKVSISAQGPPSVQLIENSGTVRPWGVGSDRAGIQRAVYLARCFGLATDVEATGAQQAKQLAGAVIDALNNKTPRKVGTAFLNRVYAPDWEGTQRDPDTRWPYIDVRIEALAGQQPVA
jgi:hypothetical protein